MSSKTPKRKRASEGAAPAAPADLKSWMRDVIAAPPAPEDAPTDGIVAQPVEMEVDDADADADDAAEGESNEKAAAVTRSHFTSVRDLFVALQSAKTETLFGGLVRFHRQMKDETTHGVNGSSDPSATLLAQYWANSPDAKELLAVLDTFTVHEAKRQNQILAKVFDVISRLILPSTAGFNYALSQTLLRKVIRSTKNFSSLTRLLKMSDQRLVQSGMYFVLHTVMCCGSNMSQVVRTSGGPSSSALLREFVTKFSWGSKWWLEIPYKPYQSSAHGPKGKQKDHAAAISASSREGTDPAAILLNQLHKSRQIFITIIVELLAKQDVEITAFILGVKGFITSVLKHLKSDPISCLGTLDAFLNGLIHHVLHLPGLQNQTKFGFFNSYVLEHLLELFKARAPETGPVVQIGGRAGKGKFHQNKGRSAREQIELIERTMKEFIAYLAKHQTASVSRAARGVVDAASPLKQHGPLLLRMLHNLHANESAAEQGLALDILRSFPPQITAEFLARFSYTFDPRASFRWVNHVDLICKVWSLRWEDRLVPAGPGSEYPLLTPFVPLHGGAPVRFTAANASTFPLIFAFLLPSTLGQRIILSQCVQHANSLVRYSTLGMLRALLKRFGQLQREYAREWAAQQGVSAEAAAASTSVALHSALALHRVALGKILPDVQVIFAMRTKIVAGQSDSLAKMQSDLQDAMAEAEDGAPKKKQKTDGAVDADGADSATTDPNVVSTLDLALRSRHLLYSRFLSALASYAAHLPEVLLEGRIDTFKLLPSVGQSISWWQLHELLTIWRHTDSYKQARLFVLTQVKDAASTSNDAPQSYFGHLLRLLRQMTHDSNTIVNGHESAILADDSDNSAALAAPIIVRERMKEFIAQILVHTGLFSSNNDSTDESSVVPPSSLEEIHLWLDSIRTPQDARAFELLVAGLVSSNTAWMKIDDAEDAAVKNAPFKLSLLLTSSSSSSYQTAVTAAGLQKEATAFVRSFVMRLLTSPTIGGEQIVGAQIDRALKPVATKKDTISALLKEAKKDAAAAQDDQITLRRFQAALAALVGAPADITVHATLLSTVGVAATMAESTKSIMIAYAREALLQLLTGDADAQAVNAVWSAIESLLRSDDFTSRTTAATSLVLSRLAILLSASLITGEQLAQYFDPASESPLTHRLAHFLLATTPSAEVTVHAAPFFNKIADASIALAKTAPPTAAITKLPFVLAILQRAMPHLAASHLRTLSHAFCAPGGAGVGWVQTVAALPDSSEALLAEQLLAHGGAQAVHMLAGIIVAGRTPASVAKKSKKSDAAVVAAPTSFVLEALLLKLLTADSGASLLSQLQPSFFHFVIESIYAAPSALESTDDAVTARAGAELYAGLGALFLRSDLAALYVPLFLAHVAQRFEADAFTKQASRELLQLLPLITRAVSTVHLATSASVARAFADVVLRALGDVFVPFFVANHTAAAKKPKSALAATLARITETVRAVAQAPAIEFDLHLREQLLQFVLTGTKPALVDDQPQPKKAKKKSSKKKKDSSSSSSSSSSDDDDDDAAASVPAASSAYESFDPVRFRLAHSLLTCFPSSSGAEDVADPSAASQSSLAQSYAHFMSQSFTTLHKSLKAHAKYAENKAAATADGDVAMETPKLKGMLSEEAEAALIAGLSELLTSSSDASFATGATSAAVGVKWVTMLPLSQLLAHCPNADLNTALLESYAKIFPSLLRFGYTSLAHITLLRNCLLWQLSGVFSRNVFLQRIVPLKHNHHFTIATGEVDDKGEEIEEPEVPSLLSICALAASPDAEDFKPLAATVEVPSAQALFELIVSHSKFVGVIAPNAVATEEEPTPSAAAAATSLQLEYLRLLLLLFSFPDSSPPCDFKLQSNLWLLLFSTYQASTSTSDCYIKLLMDLFEEIILGAKLRKAHKKMEWETIVSHRRWGAAGLQLLSSKMYDPDAGAGSITTLGDMDPSSWLYTNFQGPMLQRGPIISKKPQSSIMGGAAEPKTDDGTAATVAAPVDPLDSSFSTSDVRYDPSFLLPFFHHFFSSYPIDARRFVDMHGLSFILQCMSHASTEVRRMAYACMGKFQSVMEQQNASLAEEKEKEKEAAAAAAAEAAKAAEESDDEIGLTAAQKKKKKEKVSKTWEAKKALYHDANRQRSANDGQTYTFKEYPQIALLLTALKNGITARYQLLPGIVSTFLARAAPILLRPDHSLYKTLNRFLLARPLLDLNDIPLFYAYFHSTAVDWRLQRSFMLRTLRDGFATHADYDLMRRRHVAEILLNFVANKSLSDKYTRLHAMQVIEGGLSISAPFLAEIVRVHAFYAWVAQGVLALRNAAGWHAFLPVLQVAERSMEQIRARIPAQPEEDVDVADAQEAAEAEASDSDSDDEDVAMADVDGEDLVGEKVASEGQSKKARAPRAPLSPQAEALKALRKRQRQRAQIARELVLLVDALAGKFHEFLWTERLASVVAPIGAAANAPATTSPLSTQQAVVECTLRVLSTALSTAQRAHVASKRLTNRAQLHDEGSAAAATSAAYQPSEWEQYAPTPLRPVFLNAIASLPASFPGLSSTALDHLIQVSQLSSPTPVIPGVFPSAAVAPLPVFDSAADVTHYFHTLPVLASRALVGGAAKSAAFLTWLDLLLQAHPGLVSAWWQPSPHADLARTLVAFYAVGAAAPNSGITQSLNRIFARLLGAGAKDTKAIITGAIQVAPLSSAHRAAYTAAWSSLLKHAYPLMTSSSVASSSSWLHGFSSLLLQELWSLQLDHALHAAKSTSAPVEDDHRQSTAFALMQAAGKQKKDKKETDAWIAAQASIAADLSAHVEAFATQ